MMFVEILGVAATTLLLASSIVRSVSARCPECRRLGSLREPVKMIRRGRYLGTSRLCGSCGHAANTLAPGVVDSDLNATCAAGR
jgi:hypothetical protein